MHVAVIGAGIGGLAASVRLAVAGCDVTVIEAATAPGGKLRQALIEGRSVDVGPTVLTMRDVFDDIFFAAGERLDDHLTLTPSETIARHVFPGGAVLDLFADPARSQAAVEAFSGTRSRDEFAAFSVKAKDVHDTLAPIFMRAERPTGPLALVARAGVSGLPALMRIGAQRTYWQALQAQFSDPRLRQLFGRYATYNGSSPFLAPATLMLIAHVEAAGVYLVEGGMHRLATAMAGLAERCGVEFRYGAPVTEIESRFRWGHRGSPCGWRADRGRSGAVQLRRRGAGRRPLRGRGASGGRGALGTGRALALGAHHRHARRHIRSRSAAP